MKQLISKLSLLVIGGILVLLIKAYFDHAHKTRCLDIVMSGVDSIKEDAEYRRRVCSFMESDACFDQSLEQTEKDLEDLRKVLRENNCEFNF